ncbi:ATP-dependent helicase rad16 [Hyphodiscus hymeniophilus]|uniref:ATP-dependent helicase rad16 n=1 Tax=Hyphodiscus hymeniophilus TaxID=353542 RepID=A0A9P6SJZ9_9HELO|nr:ATP-dependent helicase rad16 [Hyphodiscus hymeniophilus]
MAPSGRPRGRPKKLGVGEATDPISITTSTTTSRPSYELYSNLAEIPGTSEPSLNGDDSSDFPDVSMISQYGAKMKSKAIAGRDSLSSVVTSNDFHDSSGYSTPATSAAPTPLGVTADLVKSAATSSKKRGRRLPSSTMTSITPSVDAVARAAALRNSQFSLNPTASKRKNVISDDEDEDNTPDAQLARALQEQEDAAADGMASSSRRTPRKAQKILPMIDYQSGSGDDDDAAIANSSSRPAKKPRIELGAFGSNQVRFSPRSKASKPLVVEDSEDFYTDDSDRFVAIDDSDVMYDSDVHVPMVAPRSRTQAKKPAFKVEKMPSKFKVPARSARLPKSAVKSRFFKPALKTEDTKTSTSSALSSAPSIIDSEFGSDQEDWDAIASSDLDSSDEDLNTITASSTAPVVRPSSSRREARQRINLLEDRQSRRGRQERARLEKHHPELHTMWKELENLPKIGDVKIEQPTNISRELKPFQLEGVAWMRAMEDTDWGGGLLGDEMGMGKTIQAVSLIMSDFPAAQPSLVLIPPVALMQWQQEIKDYTDGTLKTFVFHGTNAQTKGVTLKELKAYDVILMSYNSLESMYRKQEKGFKRKNGIHKEKSVIHQIQFHRVILDEAHNIKQRTTGSAKACFALKADHKWCLSGTPLQNRIGEFFSLVRFLDIRPFACYFCKQCSCSTLNWDMNEENRCKDCNHTGMQHVSVFNQELLNPIQKFGNKGPGKEAFRKLRILTDRFMLRRVKRDHSSSMELPAKEIYVDRQFFGEEENDFAGSIMNSGTRKFETYVAQGVLLNNYANIFGLIMQMRQVADHPDLILKKNGEGGQNVLVCCICDETAEEAIRSSCRHEFCRECAKNYLHSSDEPDCPQCHIPLSIDLEQPEIEQDEQMVKKSSIINRIKMENWTSSSKIEALVHDLHELRSKNMSSKSIIFSQFTTMLQLVEWRLRRAGITTVMLDGSMTPAQRQASINHFMTNVNVECFLVSLKAGGVALNLTEASKVFIVDPWWNPAAEWQSADRCHRIGQARPCSITRLCIEDSVESRMVLLQEKKANMINSTINADDSAMESLTPEDMQFLFRGN